MILPTTHTAALLLMLVCMLCWGSWANAYKVTGKWRFELFSYDWALGVGVCAVAAALTFGSMNSQDLTFQDNFLIASLRKMAYAVGVGMLLNLGSLFLAGAVSIGGMGVTFPLCTSMIVLVGALMDYFSNGQSNPALLFGGLACLLVSIVAGAYCWGTHLESPKVAKTRRPDPKTIAAGRTASAGTSIVLALLGGILIGLSWPVVEWVRSEENGVGPYGLALLFAAGIFSSTFLIVPFLMNFPFHGPPIEIRDYFGGSKGQHLWGIAGGIVWMIGTIACLAAMSTPSLTASDTATNFGLAFAAAVVGALWGLLVWRDFRGSRPSVKVMLLGMLVFYAVGAGMVALAPAYGK